MAEKRMFSKSIVLTDAFLDMPMSARCLYFTLSMVADDDGFVSSPKSVMRQCGATTDDMGVLVSKRFVLVFESGVVVIKHWRINNYLQKDRYTPTNYQEEMSTLMLDSNHAYTEREKPMYTECIQDVYTDKNSIDKNSIDEVSIEEEEKPSRKRFTAPSLEEVRAYCKERNNNVDPQAFIDFYSSKGWKVGNQPMKDWQAAVRTWERRETTQKASQKKKQYVTAAEYQKPQSNKSVQDMWDSLDMI